MERRNFLRAMLGVAAVTALPFEVWPFRKIFLPPVTDIGWVAVDWGNPEFYVTYLGLSRSVYPGALGAFLEMERKVAELTTGLGPPALFGADNRTAASVIAHRREAERKMHHVFHRFLS